MSRRSARIRQWMWKRPWALGLIVMIGFEIVVGAVSTHAWLNTRGLVREHVEVISRETTGDTVKCGGKYFKREKPEYLVTYRSENPPAPRPQTFQNYEGCGAHSIGDQEVVVRTVDNQGTLTVWFLHPETLPLALLEPLRLAVPIGLGTWLLTWFFVSIERKAGRESHGKHADRGSG